MIRCINKSKMNNEGFSLIEVIVAMSILVIVSIPLLSSINSSARTNIKSREKQRATLIAQNVVEGIKSYSLDEMKEQFQDITQPFSILQGYGSFDRSELVKSVNGSGVDVFRKGNTSTFQNTTYYGIMGVTEKSSKYDVMVEVKSTDFGSASVDPLGVVNIASENTSVIDNTGLAYPEDLVVAGSTQKTYAQQASEYIATLSGDSYATIMGDLKCNLYVYVKKNGSYAEVNGIASYSYGTYSKEFLNLGMKKFSGSNNIYIFFTPVSDVDNVYINYNITDDANKSNIIIVSNETGTRTGSFDVDIASGSVTDWASKINLYTNCTTSSVFSNIYRYFSVTGGADLAPIDNNVYAVNITVNVYKYTDNMDDKFKTDLVSSMTASKFE